MVREQEIIALQKRILEEQYSSIESAVTYIDGNRYHFVEQEIKFAGIIARLPNEFIDLPHEIAKQKYPSEARPKCIKSNTDVSINLAFSLLPDAIRDEELITIRNDTLTALKRIYPQNTYLETGVDYSGNKNRLYTWYEYYGPTLDVEAYALNAFMQIKKRMLHVLFNCPKSNYEKWRPIVFEIISSIREDQNL